MKEEHKTAKMSLILNQLLLLTCMIFDELLAHLILLNGPTIAESTLRDLL